MIVMTALVPSGFAAITLWPFIFIAPERANDEALIAHEQVHYQEQAWCTPVWWAQYLFSTEFRLKSEVRGYKKQIELGGITEDEAADMLLTYKLGITKEQALEALRG